jgi:hypothetical protein
MPTHLLCVGSDNHHLRLPFLQAVTKRGCRHCNGHCQCGSGSPKPIPCRRHQIERSINSSGHLFHHASA